MKSNIDWFWAHRRNASLHHLSFLMQGLAGRGWMPMVDFWIDNQIIIGVPGKGCYIFYDRNQLSAGAKYRGIQQSIDKNPNFVADFRRRTDELFGVLCFKSYAIELENLSLLSGQELCGIYREFIQSILAAPIISVQLWGIEACFEEDYKIMSFLRERLQELGKGRDLETYKSILAANTGETVALTEQKDFYRVATMLRRNPQVATLFARRNPRAISQALRSYPAENRLFARHIQKYAWINTEYVGGAWPREKWVELFQKALVSDVTPESKLEDMSANVLDLTAQKQAALAELQPPVDVAHALEAVAELIAQRDWTKGYFARSLLSYSKLLDEIAARLGVIPKALLSYSYDELDQALAARRPLAAHKVVQREAEGFAIVIKHGQLSLVGGDAEVQKVVRAEGLTEPFEELIHTSEFRGLPASPGTVRARARVLENASMIPEMQEGEILVTYMTTIEFTPIFRKAAAVITDEGGMSCHAAIISREFKLPCVVGTKVATRVVRTGDLLEVDATAGTIKILSQEPH